MLHQLSYTTLTIFYQKQNKKKPIKSQKTFCTNIVSFENIFHENILILQSYRIRLYKYHTKKLWLLRKDSNLHPLIQKSTLYQLSYTTLLKNMNDEKHKRNKHKITVNKQKNCKTFQKNTAAMSIPQENIGNQSSKSWLLKKPQTTNKTKIPP